MKTYDNEFFVIYNNDSVALPVAYCDDIPSLADYLGITIVYTNKITSDFRNKVKTHVRVRNRDILISKFKETKKGNVVKVW